MRNEIVDTVLEYVLNMRNSRCYSMQCESIPEILSNTNCAVFTGTASLLRGTHFFIDGGLTDCQSSTMSEEVIVYSM